MSIHNDLAPTRRSIPEHARAQLTDPGSGDISDRFDAAFLARHFDLKDIGKSNARFDRAKLLAFNAHTIQRELTDLEFQGLWTAWLADHDPTLLERFAAAVGEPALPLLARAARPRAKTLAGAADPVAFVLLGDTSIEHDPKAAKKALLKGEPSGLDLLPEIRAALAAAGDAWRAARQGDPAAIEDAVKAFCQSRDLGIGKAAQPLRVALTGTAVSPPLGETLALLGPDRTLARIDHCLRTFAEQSAS